MQQKPQVKFFYQIAPPLQFLGPAMQEEVLKLVLLALEDGSALSRKVLVMFVVQRLEGHFPQASKTSIGHVVQLLYRASCFKVTKREGDSSLMQLKEEFRTYESLRREHDSQIVQIATEAGLRIAPDQVRGNMQPLNEWNHGRSLSRLFPVVLPSLRRLAAQVSHAKHHRQAADSAVLLAVCSGTRHRSPENWRYTHSHS